MNNDKLRHFACGVCGKVSSRAAYDYELLCATCDEADKKEICEDCLDECSYYATNYSDAFCCAPCQADKVSNSDRGRILDILLAGRSLVQVRDELRSQGRLPPRVEFTEQVANDFADAQARKNGEYESEEDEDEEEEKEEAAVDDGTNDKSMEPMAASSPTRGTKRPAPADLDPQEQPLVKAQKTDDADA